MNNKIKKTLTNLSLILVSVITIICLFKDWKKPPISTKDIEYIEGEITFIDKTYLYGKHRNEEIVYFQIKNCDLTFRILGIPYKILENKKMISKIESKKKVILGISKNYAEKSSNDLKDKILNQIITDRIKPNIYYLKKGELELISLNEYNQLDYNRRFNNFWVGSLISFLAIIITSTLIILEYKKTSYNNGYN